MTDYELIRVLENARDLSRIDLLRYFTRTIYSKIDVEREQEIVIYDDEVLFITKNSTVHFSYGAFLGTCETDDFVALILK